MHPKDRVRCDNHEITKIDKIKHHRSHSNQKQPCPNVIEKIKKYIEA